MKKNLLYLFTILCTLSFVTSCSDDDDDKALNAWKNLATDYSGANLTLTLDGTAVTGKTVKLNATSADAGTLTLTDIAPEVTNVNMDVKLTRNATGYDIEGSKDMSGYVVSVTGKVTDDSKMTLAVTTEGWELAVADYTGDKLALQLNGETVADKTVAFKSTSKTTADVTLKNIVNGLEEMVVPVKLLIVKSEQTVETYNFEGSNNDVEGYQVSVKGSVNTQGQMTMDVTVEGWKSIAKAYDGEELVMTINEKAVEGHTVTVEVISETEATITFGDQALVEGVKNPVVTAAITQDATGYKLEGKAGVDSDWFFDVTSTIVNGKLTLNVKTTSFKTALIGKWNVKKDAEGKTAEYILHLVTQSGNLSLPKELVGLIIPGSDKDLTLPVATIEMALGALLGENIMYLNSIEFTADKTKNINITYTTKGTAGKVEELKGLLQYTWVKDKESGEELYIGVNMEELMKLTGFSFFSMNSVKSYDGSTILTEGMPFNYKLEDGVLSLSVPRESIVPAVSVLDMFVSMMLEGYKGEENPSPEIVKIIEGLSMVSPILTMANGLLSQTTELEVGLVFTK